MNDEAKRYDPGKQIVDEKNYVSRVFLYYPPAKKMISL